jgi:hypothetical protein
MLFHLWTAAPHRPTRDVDLLGRGTPDLALLEEVFRAVCALAVEEDGLDFAPDSVVAERFKDDAEYEGVRVMLDARLGSARIRLQIDVGFGDAVVPPPEPAEFPVLLDQPAPRLRVYWRQTVVAEKLQAMVDLGLANSRMKDFFDLRFLASTFDFAGPELAGAIEATFARRNTAVPQEVPTGLTDGFAADTAKQTQWRAFPHRSRPRPRGPRARDGRCWPARVPAPAARGAGAPAGRCRSERVCSEVDTGGNRTRIEPAATIAGPGSTE